MAGGAGSVTMGAWAPPATSAWSGPSLLRRVVVVNGVVLAVAAVTLVATPATVSYPVALTELGVLALGIAAMLVFNAVALRRTFGPLRRLTELARVVDPLSPG